MAAVAPSHGSFAASRQSGAVQPMLLPTTAAVLEYRCLFTSDLKRKQKRWQDGRLKFHAFNKRVMVYDERGNFIGDAHWREDYDFDEGEEFRLERGAVIVQVSDFVDRQNQDLTDLLDRRAREAAKRQSQAQAQSPFPAQAQVQAAPPQPIQAVSSPSFGFRSAAPAQPVRPLHRPPGGLAVSSAGARGAREALLDQGGGVHSRDDIPPGQGEAPRPAKRRRVETSPPSKTGYAQSLFGATLTLSATPASTPRPRVPPLHDITNNLPAPLGRDQDDGLEPGPERREPPPPGKERVAIVPRSLALGTNRLVKPRKERQNTAKAALKEYVSVASEQLPRPARSQKSRQETRDVGEKSTGPQASVVVLDDEEPSGAADQGRRRRHASDLAGQRAVADLDTEDGVEVAEVSRTVKAIAPGKDTSKKKRKDRGHDKGSDQREVSEPHDRSKSRQARDGPRQHSVVPPDLCEPRVDEPRTELRIKSTRRRGLLSLAEKAAAKRKAPEHAHKRGGSQAQPDQHTTPGSSETETSVGSRRPSRVGGNQSDQPDGPIQLDEPLVSPACGTEALPEDPSPAVQDKVNASDAVPPPPNLERLEEPGATEKDPSQAIANWILNGGIRYPGGPSDASPPHDGTEMLDVGQTGKQRQPGPRLASLGRRGIRSKEIIGYVRRPEQPAAASIAGASVATPAMGVGSERRVIGAPPKRPNPATRGRKAAQKSDAAGCVPQSVVPTTPATLATPTTPATPSVEVNMEIRALPGFARAGGGPWSREAYDLLGIERPK